MEGYDLVSETVIGGSDDTLAVHLIHFRRFSKGFPDDCRVGGYGYSRRGLNW